MKAILQITALFSFFWLYNGWAQIPIIVQERAGHGRNSEPVTLGVPFARGELLPNVPVRLVEVGGNPVEAQFKPMAVWDDGSTKWLKCDFQARVAANSTAQYTLEKNASHSSATELTAIESSSEIIVTTGPLRFAINKMRFNLFDRVWLDLNGDRQYTPDEEIISPGSRGPVVTANGLDYLASAQPPEQIEIEEQGPMKVVIKVSGRHYNDGDFLLKYETRIYAYAGQPYVKLWHVYANGQSVSTLGSSVDPAFSAEFDRYALEWQLNLAGAKTVRLGGDNGAEFLFSLPIGNNAHLLQHDRNDVNVPLSFDILQNNQVVSSGSRAEGWGDFRDDKWGLLISTRYFWQKYPKGVLFDDNGKVALELAPTPEYFWPAMGTGDEILLYFHPASETTQAHARAMSLSKKPLFPHASPQQYVESNVFYALSEGLPTRWPRLAGYIDEATQNHFFNREDLALYGNINFGDAPSEPYGTFPSEIDNSGWGNNYYDGLLLTPIRLFAQTGDLTYADIFIPGAWHWMETDCWNTYDADDWMNGYCPAYSAYHRLIGHFQHHYGEGIWYYYYLTGDERAREVGLRAANSIIYRQTWGNENTGCRQAYQRASACLEAWKCTRDSIYLNHARLLLVDRILATQDQFGLIGGWFEEGGFRIEAEQTFMMALYSDALWKYIQELPREDSQRQELIDKFLLLAEVFDRYARKNPGQEEYWNWWNNPPGNSTPPDPYVDPNEPDATVYWNGKCLMAGTYAYAYDLSGDERYKTLAINLLDDIWTAGGEFGNELWGKASGQAMKNMLHAAAIVARTSTAVESSHNSEAPIAFELLQNYPNPFNPVTSIQYSVGSHQFVSLKVYDALGKEVAVLVNERQPAGNYRVSFEGRNLPSGVYFYKLSAGNFAETRKMLLLR
jgi:hypothetical protein